jgi:recombinational DNA repair ATPase RecF
MNIFIGNNAQGKTNILESIYILALTKSHRLGVENNLIRNGSNFFKITGTIKIGKLLNQLKFEDNKSLSIDTNVTQKCMS